MKITKDKIFIRLDHLADGAVYFGCGYWLLSMLEAKIANLVAWIFALVGFAVSLALFRWRRERRLRFKMITRAWQGKPVFIFALKEGTARDEIFSLLKEMHATILKDSPEKLVSAEFSQCRWRSRLRELSLRSGMGS